MMGVNSVVRASKFSYNYKNEPVLSYGHAQKCLIKPYKLDLAYFFQFYILTPQPIISCRISQFLILRI